MSVGRRQVDVTGPRRTPVRTDTAQMVFALRGTDERGVEAEPVDDTTAYLGPQLARIRERLRARGGCG